jgi:hypothetical protein
MVYAMHIAQIRVANARLSADQPTIRASEHAGM